MKQLRILPLLCLCLIGAEAVACGSYNPTRYYNPLYRLYPITQQPPSSVRPDFATANILLWSQQTGFKDTAAIRQAIYTLTLRDWESASRQSDNAFVRHLAKHRHAEALHLLVLSKQYETVRNQMRSPWYYNSRTLGREGQLLDSLLMQSEGVEGKYAQRYIFLRMKVLWAMKQDSACIALWKEKHSLLKGTPFYDEAENYLARCYRRLGRDTEADEIYVRQDLVDELADPTAPLYVRLRELLRLSPNSPQLIPLLQSYLTYTDYQHYDALEYGDETVDSMIAVAHYALSLPTVKRKDVWSYAAACLYDLLHQHQQAYDMLKDVRVAEGDSFLRDAVKVLLVRSEGCIKPVDDDYFLRVRRASNWLISLMNTEYRCLSDSGRMEVLHAEGYHHVQTLQPLYAYGALRRLMVSDSCAIAWRLARAGRTTEALHLANIANNYFFSHYYVPALEEVRRSDEWVVMPYGDIEKRYHNYHDYSNDLFLLADELDANAIREYCNALLTPQGELWQPVSNTCYADSNYWFDILGTHLLREQRYAEAAEVFTHVDGRYQRRMNLRCHRDAFAVGRHIPSHDSTHYKLHFAQRMDSLQQLMLRSLDPAERAMAALEYSIGLENSFDACWWLTAYARGDTYSQLTDARQTPWANLARRNVLLLRKAALRLFPDRESATRYYLRLARPDIVRSRYADTPTGELLALVCDSQKMHRAQ